MILASTDSVKKIKDQSDKNKLDAALAKNATAAQEKLDKLKLDLPALQKALQEKTAAYTAAVAGLKDAQMKLIAATPLVPALPKQIDAMQKAMPAAQALVTTLTTKVQDLEKQIGAKEASLQRYKKAQPLANAPKS
jgi:chromosome segregation ATPase